MPTITTLLRLADDSTAPITITRRGPCCQWSVVTIEGEKVKHCRRGHVIIRQTAALDRNGHLICKVCKRANDRRWYRANADKKNKAGRKYWHTVRKLRNAKK